MARTHPAEIDPEASPAERYVFGRLRDALPDDWLVVHSRRFFRPARAAEPGRPGRHGPAGAGAGASSAAAPGTEGEVDFLILDPRRGYLALEVKGGGVRRERDTWYSRGRDGVEHRIHDPGLQASRGVRAIHAYLRARPWFERHPWPGYAWGVCLPDVDVPGDLGPDLPREKVIDRSDFTNIHAAVERILAQDLRPGPPLPEGTTRAFLEALAPRIELAVPLTRQLDLERDALLQLTEEQTAVLDFLDGHTRAAIRGAAGTGKTLVAAEQARRLADEGQRVLLLCFNRPLADFLTESVPGPTVQSFHGLCEVLAHRAGMAFEPPSAPKASKQKVQAFWEDDAPALLELAAEALAAERFDAIIVDEGQDFRPHWWPPLEGLLRDPAAGLLHVFYDPNQDLYGGGPPEGLGVAPTTLRWNCRNTGRIARYASDLIDIEAHLRPGTPEGDAVVEIACRDAAGMCEKAREHLERLLLKEGLEPERVAVLSTRAAARSPLWKKRRLGAITLIGLEEAPGRGRVRFTSLHRFKGLEADVILLCDIEPGAFTSSPRHLYVGASRARHRLVALRYAAG